MPRKVLSNFDVIAVGELQVHAASSIYASSNRDQRLNCTGDRQFDLLFSIHEL